MLNCRNLSSWCLFAFFMVLSVSCGNEEKAGQEEKHIHVQIDSTYHAMNPMDLDFDSLELVMIDSGMAELVDAYRAIRAYGFQIPEPTPKVQ